MIARNYSEDVKRTYACQKVVRGVLYFVCFQLMVARIGHDTYFSIYAELSLIGFSFYLPFRYNIEYICFEITRQLIRICEAKTSSEHYC